MLCSSYLLVSCAVLKCYKFSNLDIIPSNSTIEECWYPNNEFCATAKYKNGEVSHLTCGDDEFCTRKGCVDYTFCKKPGTFELDFPGLSNVKFTIICCDADLCNVENSAKSLYKNSSSCLFYICIFYYYFCFVIL